MCVILFATICGQLPFEDKNTSDLFKKILGVQYTIPSHVSQDWQSFLKGLLNIDPSKRFNLEQIKQHLCFNLYKRVQSIPQRIIIGYSRIPIDDAIVDQLAIKGLNSDYIKKFLDANKHNNLTTAYFLILKNHLIGSKSIADINSNNFNEKLLEPVTRPIKAQQFFHQMIQDQLIMDLKTTKIHNYQQKLLINMIFQDQSFFFERNKSQSFQQTNNKKMTTDIQMNDALNKITYLATCKRSSNASNASTANQNKLLKHALQQLLGVIHNLKYLKIVRQLKIKGFLINFDSYSTQDKKKKINQLIQQMLLILIAEKDHYIQMENIFQFYTFRINLWQPAHNLCLINLVQNKQQKRIKRSQWRRRLKDQKSKQCFNFDKRI